MIEIIPNWHPIFVHFTVALLSMASLLLIAARFVPESLARQWSMAGRWCLWLGALFAIVTVAAGLYAEDTVAHGESAHEAIEDHEALALTTLGWFLVLAAWALWKVRKGAEQALRHGLFLLLLAIGAGLLSSTAWHGAELVYRHGLGVLSLQQVDASMEHHHDAEDSPHEH